MGHATWDVSELRKQIGVISTALHHRFVLGNSTGRIRARDAVVSGFFASHGFLINYVVTADMWDKTARALARVGAAHLSERFIDEMSPGEARRILIARALVVEPTALILDEPTAGLDLIARTRLLEQVSHLAQTGTTIVLISHHVEEIVPEIEQVVFLKGGRVLESGPKREMMRADRLSGLFDADNAVEEAGGDYYARVVHAS
jgi:iron complex transport system ATP-binding protein